MNDEPGEPEEPREPWDELLSAASVGAYLQARKVFRKGDSMRVDELGGGVSNIVLAVSCEDTRVVVKQALPRLRVEDAPSQDAGLDLRTLWRRTRRMGATRVCIVHGDYSPKNVLIGGGLWVIDFEAVHFGDPAFDVAFKGVPLWQHLGGGSLLPLPMVNIISGELHGDTRLAFQDFLAVPVGAETVREALECASAVRSATGAPLRERGFSTLKAAEGGFAPPLPSPEAALDLWSRRPHARADHRTTRSRSPSTSPPRISSTAPSTVSKTPPTASTLTG